VVPSDSGSAPASGAADGALAGGIPVREAQPMEFGAGARRTAPEAGALPISLTSCNIVVGFHSKSWHKRSVNPAHNNMTTAWITILD